MTEQPRRFQPPLMDALGKLCTEGKEAADYLWQVPKDEAMRQKILDLLEQIAVESAKQGRKEMPRICEELKTAAQASASPQQVDILVNGFDRLPQVHQAVEAVRSEEHTSELQSQSNLVCRLLLEKKKE